mmetsp:Transcript_40073/g.85566  ORF Transcript_40073/g.85566 Transcript_40073/m.85566 type:complete len:263 (-) Transcript_40073:1166-1954(-)
MDAVVARRGGEEDRRVARAALEPMVGRVLLDVRPLLWLVGVAILAHPRGARKQLVEAAHVEERHLANDGAEELGRAYEHVAGEQPAVGAARDAEPLVAGDAASHQVLGDRLEVFVGLVPLLLERGLVPARPVLAASADVGLHVGATLLEPADADCRDVARRERDLEAAVAVEQGRRRAVERHPRLAHKKVGHHCAIFRLGEVLVHLESGAAEEGGQRLEHFLLLGRGGVRDRVRGGLDVRRRRDPDLVVQVGVRGANRERGD